MAQVFKIRRKSDGLFSTGGTGPQWSKKGKMWTGRGPLSNHLALVRANSYTDAELITYELVEQIIDVESLEDVNDRRLLNKQQREEARQARIQAWKDETEQREYNRLKAKYGDIF